MTARDADVCRLDHRSEQPVSGAQFWQRREIDPWTTVEFAIRGTSSQPQQCDEPRMAFKTGSAVSAPAHCDLKIVVVGWKNLLDQDFVDQVLPLDIRQMGALFIVC